MEKTIEQKKNELKVNAELLAHKSYEIAQRLACIKKEQELFKKDIEKNINSIKELQIKLDKIQSSIPNFDIETYNRYKAYYLAEHDIQVCQNNNNCLAESIIKYADQEKMLNAEKERLQEELEQLKAE
ncbi:MAG: hypothetical protein VZR09_06385 [Candidatus Gastranaerophilaceae bacterium]|nr:hypothetical protein [Candidatus Gastranaerophilaceae bacterium]